MKRSSKTAFVSNECVACGCCVKNCPIGAVSVFKGMYAIVNQSKCVGCGRCAVACPADVISIRERQAAVC